MVNSILRDSFDTIYLNTNSAIFMAYLAPCKALLLSLLFLIFQCAAYTQINGIKQFELKT